MEKPFDGQEAARLLEAVRIRTSRRTYIPAVLSKPDRERLETFFARWSGEGVRMTMVEEPLKSSYGMFSGVMNAAVMIADAAFPAADEKVGYYGELMVLEATSMGLGTCWMGMYDTKSAPVVLSESESAVIAVVMGHVKDPSAKEKLIRKIARRKTKSAEEMSRADEDPPAWFKAGLEAARLAPSAVNRQPVTFVWKDKTASAEVKDPGSRSAAVDLGIAKAHFALAAVGTWQWGSKGVFTKLQ